ncbi:MAG: hypothetical protein ACM336_21360 [Acidobacteriota bacterium]
MVSTAPIHPLAPEIDARLGTAFERQVLDAGLTSLGQAGNPLRLNHFATTLRELSRIVLARLAPDADIKSCKWYAQSPGQPPITRAQRITYAVQAGLLDTFVTKKLQLDVDKMRRDLLKAVDELSKYTHITPAVFGVSGQPLETLVTESLEAFLAFLEMIDECRSAVETAVEKHAREALHDELLRTTVSELDCLATHYYVEETHIETVTVTSMDGLQISFSVAGTVECQFQYGSSSDVRNGDGLVCNDSYPLKCDFEAPAVSPLEVSVIGGTLKVDNDSFYQ